ncbi:MAG: T9SS type A sorting domain-containing protein [candidate division Zixibacteria bacterium]|nr:T9SS type A sorting domain-containing protein [candidate division Zixibacteria bacterium]
MTKKALMVMALAFMLIAVNASAELSKTMPMTQNKLIKGDEPLPEVAYYPYNPGTITESPGEIVGVTYYDYQTNGSTGNRVALCDDGSMYFCWMMLEGWPYPPAARHIYYNWIDPEGNWYAEGTGGQVSESSGSGYTNLDIINGNIGAIAYHVYTDAAEMIVSEEWDPPGMGFFTHHIAPNEVFPQTPDGPGELFWPYITIDGNSNIHLLMTESTDIRMSRLGYTRSEDGGETWEAVQLVDTVMVISGVMDASPVSDKVVAAYAKCNDTLSQWNNDIVYYSSDDGTTWDWRYGMNNVTNYDTDTDSLWAYADLDVIIDYNDYIHLIWNTQWVTDEGIYYRTFLHHYSEETEEITEITAKPDSLWIGVSGVWNRTICKMNLGVQEGTNYLFTTWTQFDTSDVSAGGFGNGDIFASMSPDAGASWESPVNITDSHTPGCFPGECDSDHWSTLADVVDDNLHVFYTNDKDAGGIPQEEGAATENPMKYMTYPSSAWTGIDEEINRPINFSLNQNYPNPFNAKTTISFVLKENSPVTIDVYDITGAKITTLVDNVMTAGNHDIVWDAADVASGVYYYKLTAGDATETKQAVLIK